MSALTCRNVHSHSLAPDDALDLPGDTCALALTGHPQWRADAVPAPDLTDAITVWRAQSRPTSPEVEVLQRYLCKEEVAQAGRFRRPEDRACFVASHALLRILLATQLDAAPHQLEFLTSTHGKPRLSGGFSSQHLSFNLAHSHGTVLVALSGTEIGVDVETRKSLPDLLDIAGRFFSSGEAHALQRAPEADRESMFFRLWTMKEAVLKLTGSGIAGGLDSFRVPTVRHDSPFCASVAWNEAGLARYPEWQDTRLLSFYAWPGLPAALAWCSSVKRVRFFEGDPILTAALMSAAPKA